MGAIYSQQAKSAHFKAQQSKEKALYQYKQAVANAEVIREQFEAKFQEACSVCFCWPTLLTSRAHDLQYDAMQCVIVMV
jgi:hypothetical protein